ncbi:lipase/ esterase [Amylocystis lapponica]|nr:lipase/ esterase [Amylocystis lapponica]
MVPLNSLTRQAGIRLGPLLLQTLIKHYFERTLKEHAEGATQLHQDELLYDAAFKVIKTFLEAASKHTIEELQAFSNTRTPSPPWTHAVRLVVPMSCCDEAATHLIRALGGEEVTKRVVGGTKWWQVRGVQGIDAEWITARKDWEEAKRKHKAQQREARKGRAREPAAAPEEPPATYEPEMDEMRCILFVHGGGYYFGSIDQERYSIQRYARKINGRVFTMNYRLAPQYPFPCAVQDVLACYLFLIRPPPDAAHRPVDPAHIVVAGDSAGGGLCLALLQVLRDTALPMPAGGVLISPWCDLTHSFPSIHINTATDVLPPYGLSFHKPSTLWPPPPDDLTTLVHDGIRTRIRQAMHMGPDTTTQSSTSPAPKSPAPLPIDHLVPITPNTTLRLGSTTSLPTQDADHDNHVRTQRIELRAANGEELVIDAQLQMYTPNYLLTHPLVSPAVSYLGGLPPLHVIVCEKEVLRDEIIYSAHKAAHPDKYPVKDDARRLYPALEGIETRFGPTQVHLQIYDDAAHTLPTLFSFTTPAKYCYRAIATFCRYVTGMLPPPPSPFLGTGSFPRSRSPDLMTSGERTPLSPGSSTSEFASAQSRPQSVRGRPATSSGRPAETHGSSMRRAFSARVSRAGMLLHLNGNAPAAEAHPDPMKPSESSDVGGPRFYCEPSTPKADEGARRAGEPSVYANGLDTMIRERVSTQGVVRPLEPEEALPAFQLPQALVGELSELVVRRYMKGDEAFGRKFAKTAQAIAKKRRRNLERARGDTVRNMMQLQNFLSRDAKGKERAHGEDGEPAHKGMEEGLRAAGSWPWAWALDVDERPPPSSIVSRRDTEEARGLAKIADQAVLADEHAMSANNLWSLIVDFLTVLPEKDKKTRSKSRLRRSKSASAAEAKEEGGDAEPEQETRRSRFKQFVTGRGHGKVQSSGQSTGE